MCAAVGNLAGRALPEAQNHEFHKLALMVIRENEHFMKMNTLS